MANTREAVLATLSDKGRGYQVDVVVNEVVRRVGEREYNLSLGYELLAAEMSGTGVADDFWNMTCLPEMAIGYDRLIFGPRGGEPRSYKGGVTSCRGIVGYIDDSGQSIMY